MLFYLYSGVPLGVEVSGVSVPESEFGVDLHDDLSPFFEAERRGHVSHTVPVLLLVHNRPIVVAID